MDFDLTILSVTINMKFYININYTDTSFCNFLYETDYFIFSDILSVS
jgi:hypothetical protein